MLYEIKGISKANTIKKYRRIKTKNDPEKVLYSEDELANIKMKKEGYSVIEVEFLDGSCDVIEDNKSNLDNIMKIQEEQDELYTKKADKKVKKLQEKINLSVGTAIIGTVTLFGNAGYILVKSGFFSNDITDMQVAIPSVLMAIGVIAGVEGLRNLAKNIKKQDNLKAHALFRKQRALFTEEYPASVNYKSYLSANDEELEMINLNNIDDYSFGALEEIEEKVKKYKTINPTFKNNCCKQK